MIEPLSSIESAIMQAKTSEEALAILYRMFIPDWSLKDHSLYQISCGNGFFRFLSSLFHLFDYKQNPNLPTGVLWNCYGFERDNSLSNWEFVIRQKPNTGKVCGS